MSFLPLAIYFSRGEIRLCLAPGVVGPWGCLAILDVTDNYFHLLIQVNQMIQVINWDNQTLSHLPSPSTKSHHHTLPFWEKNNLKQLNKFVLLSLQSYVKRESILA